MITEFRRLIFSADELRKAIETFDRGKDARLPVGAIDEITIASDPEISVTARVRGGPSDTPPNEVRLDANYVAAAMLFYCSRCRIPVPKSAKKTLEIEGDCLALSLSLNSYPHSVHWETN